MDISKEYILMCREANKILTEGQFELGDYIADGKDKVGIVTQINMSFPPGEAFLCIGEIKDNNYIMSFDAIKLYRQDQLQEMVSKDFNNCFNSNILAVRAGMYENFKPQSWEQAWLVYVMKEKFNRTWNGEKWKQ